MEIYVNGELALIKKDSSFDYVSENRLFSGADDYTFNITFPIRGCQQNIAIFGEAVRKDFSHEKVVYDCEIRDKNFAKYGCIAITGVNETELTAQFLEGRSEQNFDTTFDDIYINELDLGQFPDIPADNITPDEAWKGKGYADARVKDAVALPWWNDGNPYLNNCVQKTDGKWAWGSEDYPLPDGKLSWQPYLIDITERICEQVGYTCNFDEWTPQERALLICNTLPASWNTTGYAVALPAWTVTDFFEKLELLLRCEIEIDHRGKTVTMHKSATVIADAGTMQIDNIIDEYSEEITIDNPDVEYIDAINLKYADREDEQWDRLSCDWSRYAKASESLTWQQFKDKYMSAYKLIPEGDSNQYSPFDRTFYLSDYDITIALYPYKKGQVANPNPDDEEGPAHFYDYYKPYSINAFGARITDDSPEAQETEIDFVPVRVDYLDSKRGYAMFLDPGKLDDVEVEDSANGVANCTPTPVIREIETGEEERAEFFNKIYLCYWDGQSMLGDDLFPFPVTEGIIFTTDEQGNWVINVDSANRSLRINNRNGYASIKYRIDAYKKYSFKFLSDSIPNVRALFYIHGKKYICEKITATFTEYGMSQLLKGDFYRVVD